MKLQKYCYHVAMAQGSRYIISLLVKKRKRISNRLSYQASTLISKETSTLTSYENDYVL
jgi:hypothetical protein